MRVNIATINVNGTPVDEPAATTLPSDGGSIANDKVILRLHNPTEDAITVIVAGRYDHSIRVEADTTVYMRINDTGNHRQSDGTIYIDGEGVEVVAITTHRV